MAARALAAVIAQRHRQQALRLNQDITNRQLAQILRSGAADAAQMAREIASLPGVGASTRAAQLRLAAQGAQQISSGLWNNADRTIREGIFQSVDLAIRQGLDIDRFVGMPASEIRGYSESLRASARFTTEAIINRRQFGFNLSERVYRNNLQTIGRVHRVIESGLVRNLSARELAREVRALIDPRVPGGPSYSAMRLARTEINNAYHFTSREQYATRPWVNGVEWVLSGSHPTPDICDDLAAESPYRSNEVPDKPHPQCLCYIVPSLPSEDDFLDSLLSGEYDGWLQERGNQSLVA